jgi:lipoate-protein ligase A
MARLWLFSESWSTPNELCFNDPMGSAVDIAVIVSKGPPVSDLAREAWLLEQAAAGQPSLFVTSWEGPVVALGYGQDWSEIDLDYCRARSIPVLRRLTGGTGVVHQGDLGVGLALPQVHPWAEGIVSLYGRFLDCLEPALASLGSRVSRLDDPARAGRVRSPICFLDQLSDTLVVDGKKAVGCAQTRRKGAVLIHAAVLLGLDSDLYEAIFRVPATEVQAGLAPAIEGVPWRTVGEAITAGLASALGLEPHRSDPEPVPEHFLQPYTTERWAPVLPDQAKI